MKPLIAAILWTLFNQSPDIFIIVDKDMKKPAIHANSFTTELYLQRNFPVYAGEKQELIETIDKAVKRLDRDFLCDEVEKMGTTHTTIMLQERCEEIKNIRVVLITQIAGTNSSFSFVLVEHEANIQQAQRKLLDFATYINQ